ncbi:amidohydrolase family protein [Dyadobacter pollutisoli]|uniref:Amidohydrolase family protein n=1 Tax=Dyadobacter pollutisoli TaxID=2910158 RepID=A0A9E8NFN9_9BACT|nr:amidohydrolase family protein [Dyadobacter pollutisoli]WAC14091.1 amidohydrolase family protein [Dyadobacter pollutisoli]
MAYKKKTLARILKTMSASAKAMLAGILLFTLVSSKSTALNADSLKVTITEGTNMAIALSPDKATLAMDIQGTIWTLPITGGKAKAITDALGDCRQPTWSPDGTQIAFQSYRDGNFHIWKINKDGTGLKQITFGVYHDREPHWSPDGTAIAFSSDRNGNYDIWKIVLKNDSLVRLTDHPGNDYFPAFSADGKSLAYVSERSAAAGIYISDAGGQHQLFVHSKEKLASPMWHPSSNQIIFNSLIPNASTLDIVKTGGGDWQTLSDSTEDVFPFKPSWLSETEFLYTADGQIKLRNLGDKSVKTIAFTAELNLMRDKYAPKTRDFDSVKPKPVQGIRSPIVSNNGKFIAFAALGDIWILEIGKPKPVQVTNDVFIDVDPVWSPDDKWLAFTSDRNGNMDLWIREIKTGAETCLFDAADNLKFPSWSPDGNKIAFYQADPKAYSRNTLSIIDIKTKKLESIYGGLFEASQPSWSPDGKYVVVSSLESYSTRFREGLSKFLIIPADKSEARFASPASERSLATRGKNGPVISPDGSSIAYILDNVLWTVPIDNQLNITGPPKQLTNELAEDPSWSGDSRSIVFLATDKLKKVTVASGHIEPIWMDFTWKAKKPEGRLVIHAGRVFNGKTEQYLENVDVVIEKNRIKEIVPHQAGRRGNVVNASKQTLIPGLFEMHTHQNAQLGEKGGRLWLAYGVTSIREPGTDPYDALERKESWNSGKRLGPRSFFTGGHMEGNRIYYNRNTSNVGGAQLDLELNRALTLGYDMIKTYVGLSDILQKQVTEFAHKNGLPVSSHEIYPAMGFGVDGVEHIGATSRRGYSPKLTALNKSYQDVTELVSKSGMYMTPTISLHGGFNALIQSDKSFFDHWQFTTFYSEKQKESLNSAAARAAGSNKTYHHVEKSIVSLMQKGAKLTPGTDSPIIPSGLSYHAELQSWVKAGLSPFETLRAATLWSAEEVGAGKDLGTIEPGKLADMVILDGDPLRQIKDILNVKAVIKNGEYLDIETLKTGKQALIKNQD